MTNKTTVLRHLDQYRDKTLSFGCEVEFDHGGGYVQNGTYCGVYDDTGCAKKSDMIAEHNPISSELNAVFNSNDTQKKILGHPPTLSTLLIALDETMGDREIGYLNTLGMFYIINLEEKYSKQFNKQEPLNIPLTTPLTEIPEDDKLWGQLLDLFELKV